MPDTHAVFFRLGGVLTQAPEPLLREALASYGFPETNLYSVPGFSQACEQLALGQLDGIAFCRLISEISRTGVSADALQDALLAAFTPMPEVVSSINLLPEKYIRWLVVDYPRPWFGHIFDRLLVYDCFCDENILFLTEMNLPHFVPDALEALVQRSGYRRDQCLFLDYSSQRAVSALDAGYLPVIFVDATLLRREFILRHFTSSEPLEHRPANIRRK
jgi:hypothetical protein